MPDPYEGTPVKQVSLGTQSLDRDSITVGYSDIEVRFYRASRPTIFAGLQINWIDGDDPVTEAEIDLSAGAGLGSKYMTLRVAVPGHDPVYEYVDMTEVLRQRASAIIAEITARITALAETARLDTK
jgi:hypothetical protein